MPGWRRNIPHLASALRVVAYDFRGNGDSDEPSEPCTMATFVEDTIAVIDEVGVEQAHVYGQSFGGMVAQELALAHPDRVRSLDPGLHALWRNPRGAGASGSRAQDRAVALAVRAGVP